MRDTTEHEAAISTLKGERKTLEAKLTLLDRELRQMQSKNFIEANGITLSDVEMSSGDDKPWFYNIDTFMCWLKKHQILKQFAEWNGYLHYTRDLIAGASKPTPGRMDDIPS